jgi:hypothetical protein
MESARYIRLAERLADLKKHLLPVPSPIGVYTDEALDKTRGFRLLTHAEIESYLEDRVRDIAIQAVKRWDTKGEFGIVLLSLLAFHLRQRVANTSDLKDEYSGKKARLEEGIKQANNSFIGAVERNHGIREEDILKLLFPIGIKPSQIDATWLSTIDTFGTARGTSAHSSVQTQQPIDPKTEDLTVTTIMAGLKQIDEALDKLI